MGDTVSEIMPFGLVKSLGGYKASWRGGKKEVTDYNYGEFDPYINMGDYVSFTEDPSTGIMEEVRGLIGEQVKCKIPYDFKDHVKFNLERAIPRPEDPLGQMHRFYWKYTPPHHHVIEKILAKARRRAKNV